MNEESIANNFLHSLLNDQLTSQSIVDKFVAYNPKSKDFLLQHTNLIRNELKKQGIEPNGLSVVSFSEAGGKLDDIQVSSGETKYIFAVLNNDKVLFPVMVQNNKVVAFSTMNKGGRKFFITYQ